VSVGEWTAAAAFERAPGGSLAVRAAVRVPHVDRWWPHTHGCQPLYAARLSVELGSGQVDFDLGRVGFRTVDLDRGPDGDGFGLVVNGAPLFCRGACWTPLDLARLDAEPADYRAALGRLRDAGMNMLRVSGTMTYETDVFHDLCDELGILVWQDFMFASMDYPSDEAFARAVTLEGRQLLRRLQGRPSTAVLCGSSEIEQQAAMLGLPAERCRNPLFDDLLPGLVDRFAPGTPWLRSTPTGGTLPFQADRGVTHYYGVGAYRRTFDDVRRAGVRFAAECLAFSNVPDDAMVEVFSGQGATPGSHPHWKAGVPRDAGAGWDFEDVRDHYVRQLFEVDPLDVRAIDVERYLALGRVATGEAMHRTFAEWRRPGASCRGGLVWFARDLAPGAGWGILDSTGRPKAVYWYLKRALAPVALFAIDEGLNGLWLHAVNDTCTPIDAEIRIALYRRGRRGAHASTSIVVPARGARTTHADALLGAFCDLTYAYRFGPPGHDVVAATLRDRQTGEILSAAHFFPRAVPVAFDEALAIVATAEAHAGGYVVALEANRFAHAVAVESAGCVPDDNYFDLEPGETKRVVLHADGSGRPFGATVRALNGAAPVSIAPVAKTERSRC
jgi:beta-mannosidase